MPENLLPGDVEQYTKGRLSQTDPETVRALNAALSRARRYCGWHVSPVRTETLTLDTTERSLLMLPTLKIVSLNSVIENGVTLNLADVYPSAEAPGVLMKKGWQYWRCGPGYGMSSIVVNLTHGYAAAEAEDFREAVLSMVDKASLAAGTEGSGPLVEKEVDDVRYKWASMVNSATLDTSMLSQFRILPL